MHRLAPSIIVKKEDELAAYALTALKESALFHRGLELFFRNLEEVQFRGKLLSSCHFYCIGQICVAKEYRGKGMVNLLCQKHKEIYGAQYDFILTEISTGNIRSLRTHEKIGFQSIFTHSDLMDEWKYGTGNKETCHFNAGLQGWQVPLIPD